MPCSRHGLSVPVDKAEPGTPLEIDVRGRTRAAEVRAKPLYSKEK